MQGGKSSSQDLDARTVTRRLYRRQDGNLIPFCLFCPFESANDQQNQQMFSRNYAGVERVRFKLAEPMPLWQGFCSSQPAVVVRVMTLVFSQKDCKSPRSCKHEIVSFKLPAASRGCRRPAAAAGCCSQLSRLAAAASCRCWQQQPAVGCGRRSAASGGQRPAAACRGRLQAVAAVGSRLRQRSAAGLMQPWPWPWQAGSSGPWPCSSPRGCWMYSMKLILCRFYFKFMQVDPNLFHIYAIYSKFTQNMHKMQKQHAKTAKNMHTRQNVSKNMQKYA